MSSVNKVLLVGNLGKDVELKYSQSGTAFCRFSLATTAEWADQSGQKHSETEWHNVVVWKKQAEAVAKYCSKGSKIYVEGRLKTRFWDDNGQKRYATDVQADEVKFLSSAPREESLPRDSKSRTGKPLNVPDQMGDQELDPDIPF